MVRFEGAAASGMGVVCDRYGSLWDRGGAALNRYAVDGRLLASYKLPSVQADRNSDMIALLGDTLVLRLGGQLYSLSIDAPTGSEVQPMKIAADKMSFSAKDGWVAASQGREVFLVNGAGEKKAVATLTEESRGIGVRPRRRRLRQPGWETVSRRRQGRNQSGAAAPGKNHAQRKRADNVPARPRREWNWPAPSPGNARSF